MDNELFLPVAQAYDRWSVFYDSYPNPMVHMAAEIVHRSLARVGGLSVFEFGCGTGRNLAALHSFGASHCAGCDLSSGMLKVAQSRLPQSRLLHQDMNDPLPLPDASFHQVLFCLTLEHLSGIRPPLREALRILKPHGTISIIEIHPFYSISGARAHFDDDGVEINMPVFAHQFEDYLDAFHDLELEVASCREWKPSDVGNPAPLRGLKRGPSAPLAVAFALQRRAR